MSITEVDPVCGREVRPHQNEIIYLDAVYAFCSEQCQQRFLANPRPYIGTAGRPSVQSKAALTSRRMHLGAALTSDQASTVRQQLRAMAGVTRVTLDGHYLEIIYDRLLTTPEQIEQKLLETGMQMGEDWGERLQRAFVHFKEECELGNVASDERHHHP